MATMTRQTRLEYHDSIHNSHKYYLVQLWQQEDGFHRVRCVWGRIGGYGSSGSDKAQTKEITDNAINALTLFQQFISEKEKKGYQRVEAA